LTPLLGIAGYLMVKATSDILTKQLDAYAIAGGVASESLTLIRTISAFNLQRHQLDKYHKELNKAAVKAREQGFASGLGFGSVNFAFFVSFSIAFYVGSVLVINSKNAAQELHPLASPPLLPFCQVGAEAPDICTTSDKGIVLFETAADVCSCPLCQCGCFPADPVTGGINFNSQCVTGGDVVLTFFAVLIGGMSLGQIAGPIQTFMNGRVAAAKLFKVIDRKSQIDANSDQGTKLSSVTGEIRFENVAFTYPSRKDAPVFKQLNLHIPAGKRVALVGESGSGKSTCIALLERYYDPISGLITLDGHDIRTLNVQHYRSLIGLVSQEPILFGTSIMENVRYGKPQATDEEVIQACKDANARSFLRNPPILLLDEATAALDNESERLVNEAVDRLLNVNTTTNSANGAGQRTTIVIAHRLSSIQACDSIVVLERGQVVEQGTHKELLFANGLYASFVKLSEAGNAAKRTNALSASLIDQPTRVTSKSREHQTESIDDVEAQVKVPIDISDASTYSSFTLAPTAVKMQPEARRGCCGRKAKPRTYSVLDAFRFSYPERWFFIPGIMAAIINGLSYPLFALFFAYLTETFYYINTSTIQSQTMIWCLGKKETRCS
jgi:ABC-type multidrug transport system fused ATPase/permease subunit